MGFCVCMKDVAKLSYLTHLYYKKLIGTYSGRHYSMHSCFFYLRQSTQVYKWHFLFC